MMTACAETDGSATDRSCATPTDCAQGWTCDGGRCVPHLAPPCGNPAVALNPDEQCQDGGPVPLAVFAQCPAWPADPLAGKVMKPPPAAAEGRFECPQGMAPPLPQAGERPDWTAANDENTKARAYPWPVDPTRAKYAVNVFHFNLQYVAGGLLGFAGPGEAPEGPGGIFNFDEVGVEDLILRESFLPLLDYYEAHPDRHVTLEFQAYLLEALAARFPDAMAKLAALIAQGVVEPVSFHWSDQLFLAMPRASMDKSLEFVDRTFGALCLRPSPAVFTQEGQTGPGMPDVMVQWDRTLLLMPTNFLHYQHHGESTTPYSLMTGLSGARSLTAPGRSSPVETRVNVLLAGRGADGQGVSLRWTFMDDGELWNTGLAPYLGTQFKSKPTLVQAWDDKLSTLETEGFRHMTVSEALAHMKARGVSPDTLKPVHDGDWQPKDTRNIYFWMGSCGQTCEAERDNLVRTRNYRSSLRLQAIGQALSAPELAAGPWGAYLRARLDDAWRYQLLAEVSDATGQRPSAAEVYYGLRYDALANAQADALLCRMAARARVDKLYADLDTGAVVADEPPAFPLTPKEALPDTIDILPGLKADAAPGRAVAIHWYDTPVAGVFAIEVEFGPGGDAETRAHWAGVAFPRLEEKLIFTPALAEHGPDSLLSLPLADFRFQEVPSEGGATRWITGHVPTYLPLADGLIGLGNDVYIIKDIDTVHIAAHVPVDRPVVRFIDETLPPEKGDRWRFFVVRGSPELAQRVARVVNTAPVVPLLPIPPRPWEADDRYRDPLGPEFGTKP